MTGQIKKLEEAIQNEYMNQIDELQEQNDELFRQNNLKQNTIEELETQLEDVRNANYLIRNDPSVSSIELVSTNTKFGQETPTKSMARSVARSVARSAANSRPLTGFEEIYSALENKDTIIQQITSDLNTERQRIKELIRENSDMHTQIHSMHSAQDCHLKQYKTQISQLSDEITSLNSHL